MTTTAEPQALPDAGPCRWCSDVQWDHKRGKGGCKVPGCGCDKYLPPKVKGPELPAAPEPTPDEDLAAGRTVQFATVEEMDAALAGAVPVGLVDPVETLDVERRRRREPVGEPAVTDPAAQEESLRQVAEIDAKLAEPEPAAPEQDRVGEVIRTVGQSIAADIAAVERQRDGAVAAVKRLGRERTEAELQRDQAYERVDELTTELDRIRAALGIGPDRNPVEVIEDRRVRLRDAESDLLDVRGILSPNGYPSRIPTEVDLVPTVAPAVRWLADRVDELATDYAGLNSAYTKAVGDAEDAQRRAEQLAGELDSAQATIARLTADLARANSRQQRTKTQLDEAVRVGTAAAARVRWRYDARHCDTCGFRTTVADLDHEHPLTPVTVLVVERDQAEATAPADDNSKEQ